ncbi:MAG TPA: phosphatidylserine decarboxylase family protein [bacterium]
MAKDAYGLVFIEIVLSSLILATWKGLGLIGFPIVAGSAVLLLVFTCFFFRDPHRAVPDDPNSILSPADGKVMELGETALHPFVGGPAKTVAIFLSVWNVHVNRSPVSGGVTFLEYQKGRFLPAYQKEAGEGNEQMRIGIESAHGNILMKQVAGILARRIVCRLKKGTHVLQGERFGMIKFGSRMELAFPASVRIRVRVGDKVKAGQTTIGDFTNVH